MTVLRTTLQVDTIVIPHFRPPGKLHYWFILVKESPATNLSHPGPGYFARHSKYGLHPSNE